MTFEEEIKVYDVLKGQYQDKVMEKMNREEYIKFNEVRFFFKMSMQRMQEELRQKSENTRSFTSFLF